MGNEAVAPPKPVAKVLVALAVGVPVTALIPLLRWLYDWQGALTVITLGIVPAFLFGAWLARRRSSARTAWCVLAAAPPFLLAAWSILAHPVELIGWFWLSAAVLTFLAARVGATFGSNEASGVERD
jgi:hypothetical protein